MTKEHRLKTREALIKKPRVPMNFLLGCSDSDLDNYELARLSDVANLRNQLHATLDLIIDNSGLAWLAAWFRMMDRNALKAAIENEETAMEWAARIIREGQRSEEEQIPREPMAPGVAHLAAALRYQQRNIAEGKCSVCPEPLDRNSVRFCTNHLAKDREYKRKKKGLYSPGDREYLYAGELPESTHGRQPGTLASLAMNRERKTRALLMEQGIKPESAAVTLKAAVEALLKVMPHSKAEAMTPAQLFEKAIVPSKTTGNKAIRYLLAAGQIVQVGKVRAGHPFRYYAAEHPPKMVTTRVHTRKAPPIHIPEKLRRPKSGAE